MKNFFYATAHTPKTKMRLSLSGLIGVGKTYFIKAVKRSAPEKVVLVEEPHESNPYLSDFYHSPLKFAFACQLKFLMLRAEVFEKALAEFDETENDLLSDRSLAEDRVFAEVLHEEGMLTDCDMELYDQFFELVQGSFEAKHEPEVYLFLDAKPETCLARIEERGREFEKKINARYLERLGAFYDKFLERMAETALVVRVSWDEFKDPIDTMIEVSRIYEFKKTGTMVLPVSAPKSY